MDTIDVLFFQTINTYILLGEIPNLSSIQIGSQLTRNWENWSFSLSEINQVTFSKSHKTLYT